jgi:phage shock protein E
MSRIIVDVRESFEFKMGHVKDAINIPMGKFAGDLPKQLEDVDKDTEIIVYCLSGSRASGVVHVLQSQGFTNVVNGINKSTVQAKHI